MDRINWIKRACFGFFLCAAVAIASPAQTFTTLYSFCSQSNCTDGDVPWAGLAQATNGNLYGTTVGGGAVGYGTVFKIAPGGGLATIYSFCSQTGCTDGADPYAGLVQGTGGNLYGTTAYGANSFCQQGGCGTVFEVTPSGVLTTLQSFDGVDGEEPLAALIQGTDGNFYGTTELGGAYGPGTVFKITPSGTLTTLHSFCERYPCTGGAFPGTALVQGADGNFYGTTGEGGTGNGCQNYPPEGCGTVFKITPGGNLTILYSFCGLAGCPDGGDPSAPVQASDGNLYGTTVGGGANGYGSVFKITPRGTLTTLYSFCSKTNCADGAYPYTTLIEGSDGNLYGTTDEGGAYYGGTNPSGTIFKITLSGTLTTLYSFCSQSACTDGAGPVAALVQDTNGKFYGTTEGGGTGGGCGSYGCGTLFSFSVGLSEFVEPKPNSGQVGAADNILGTALAGATSVTFNGTAATFTISSSSLITTTVPTGATTGRVEVTTPHGTIRSNVRFRVLP